MDVTKYIKSVLIIDDKQEEVQPLAEHLFSQDIYSTYVKPEDAKHQVFRNRQLIFCDLYLSDTATELQGHISELRSILKHVATPEFGSYGIVLWTSHIHHLDMVRQKIAIDKTAHVYEMPLFIVGLDKAEYLHRGSYDNILTELNQKLIEDKAAYFFMNWRHTVEIGADKALSDIYDLSPNYASSNVDLKHLLYLLADNYSGVHVKGGSKYPNMYHDAYKAFDELLHENLVAKQVEDDVDIFDAVTTNPWSGRYEEELKNLGRLNSKILISTEDVNQEMILPGSVYAVKNGNDFLEITEKPEHSISIAIELTPPCDYAQNKKIISRLVGGFCVECPNIKADVNRLNEKYKSEANYRLWPIFWGESVKFICFDFKHLCGVSDEELKDAGKYELLFVAKNKLFADILQKFSSHAARLGVSAIIPS